MAARKRKTKKTKKPQNRGHQAKAGRTPEGRFLPGVSGNPGGRPTEYTDFVKLAREVGSPVAFETLVKRCTAEDDRAAVQAALGILAYAWGRPKQAVELTGKDGGPVETVGARDRLVELLERRLALMEKRPADEG